MKAFCSSDEMLAMETQRTETGNINLKVSEKPFLAEILLARRWWKLPRRRQTWRQPWSCAPDRTSQRAPAGRPPGTRGCPRSPAAHTVSLQHTQWACSTHSEPAELQISHQTSAGGLGLYEHLDHLQAAHQHRPEHEGETEQNEILPIITRDIHLPSCLLYLCGLTGKNIEVQIWYLNIVHRVYPIICLIFTKFAWNFISYFNLYL